MVYWLILLVVVAVGDEGDDAAGLTLLTRTDDPVPLAAQPGDQAVGQGQDPLFDVSHAQFQQKLHAATERVDPGKVVGSAVVAPRVVVKLELVAAEVHHAFHGRPADGRRAKVALHVLADVEDPDAFRALETYDWPGNVRELENAVERALIFHRGDVITMNDLPETIRAPRAKEVSSLPVSLPEAGLSLEGVEKELIVRALQKHDWNQSRAARYLGITRHTLLYRMDKHGIARPAGRGGHGEEREALAESPETSPS